jgi:hypothetical protein
MRYCHGGGGSVVIIIILILIILIILILIILILILILILIILLPSHHHHITCGLHTGRTHQAAAEGEADLGQDARRGQVDDTFPVGEACASIIVIVVIIIIVAVVVCSGLVAQNITGDLKVRYPGLKRVFMLLSDDGKPPGGLRGLTSTE